jgi:predicted RNA-binding Zn-ribbon protein involved in translation (DUF1610 family)
MPAGGLSSDGRRWLPAGKDFLLPVKALSSLFRAKFRDALCRAGLFDQVPPEAWRQDWVVHCKPVGDGAAALKYLAPYVFRVAISNNRIVKLQNDQVTFRYKNSGEGETRYHTLPAEAFIRRFLQHVLPKGFMKIRYYGFLSAGNRARLKQLNHLLGTTELSKSANSNERQSEATQEACPFACPKCGQTMELVQIIRVRERCPP